MGSGAGGMSSLKRQEKKNPDTQDTASNAAAGSENPNSSGPDGRCSRRTFRAADLPRLGCGPVPAKGKLCALSVRPPVLEIPGRERRAHIRNDFAPFKRSFLS